MSQNESKWAEVERQAQRLPPIYVTSPMTELNPTEENELFNWRQQINEISAPEKEDQK